MNAAVAPAPTKSVNTSQSGKSPARTRQPVVPPKKVPKDMTVFDYLRGCTPPLDKKIIEIACVQTQVPPDLRGDAAQEISMMWSQMKPDTKKYKPGQIASYAHHMARHAALRTRRELGSSVRLPGSAFRKRKDGTSYVTPGVLAAALDWNEMENWFQTDGAEGGPGSESSAGSQFAGEMGNMSQTTEEAAAAEDNAEEALAGERQDALSEHKDVLTPRQLAIMGALIEGANYEEVMAEQGIKKGVLMREIAIASSIMGQLG
jgi:hypothetical protein